MKTLAWALFGVIIGAGATYWLTPVIWGVPWSSLQTMMLIVISITLIPFMWWINKEK